VIAAALAGLGAYAILLLALGVVDRADGARLVRSLFRPGAAGGR
jgi:hypothetical protein